MENAGYIKLYRKLLEWGWYSTPSVKDVFIHLVLTANYAPSVYKGVEIERGQAVYGLDSLSKATGFSVKQVRTAIQKLKGTGEIAVWTNRQFSVATIRNYEQYQSNEDSTERANEGQTKGTQRAVSKEIKKERSKEIYTYVLDEFNSICKSLPKIKSLNDTRKRRVDKAAEILGEVTFTELFGKIEQSDFLTGRVKDWRADFDWIMKPEHLTRILEGNYDNRTASQYGGMFSTQTASFDVSKYENSDFFGD